MSQTYTLVLSCPDRVGIVSDVSQFISSHKGWITEADYHSDPVSGRFYMRQEILADSLDFKSSNEFQSAFAPIAKNFNMQWKITDSNEKPQVIILISKQDHCLADILYRWRRQEIPFDIPCVISNHETHRDFVEWHKIPFFHVPVNKNNKKQAFDDIDCLYQKYNGDVMVLARYMQILPETLCQKYPGQIINIHHSFLPSFIGDKPYHKAYDRGVKLVGATCHYVTTDLDEGPIIEQDVIRVDHSHSVKDMIRLGKDVEKTVLAHGLRYHLENRIMIHENKTVVFK